MVKRLSVIIAIAALVFATGCVAPATAYAKPPQRIVSTAPSVTETLFALGLGESVVAVTDYCDRPIEALDKPKIGGMTNPSIEAIISSRPDIVVITTDGNPRQLKDTLERVGIRVHVFSARTLKGLPAAIRGLGEALSTSERAEALANEIEDSFKALEKRTKERANGRTRSALFIVWPEPLVVAGPGTAISEAMEMVGLDNIAEDASSPWPKFSIEVILSRSPELIFTGVSHNKHKVLMDKLLKKLSPVDAVRLGEVHYLSDALYRVGPSAASGVEELELATSGKERDKGRR